MTIDPSHPAPTGPNRLGAGLGHVVRWWLRPVAVAERMRILPVGGWAMRVAVREGNPDWPPLLLCNGIGASLEALQPFVDALDPHRPVIRFDMPGIGGSPAPVVPYHLGTAAPRLAGLLDQLGYRQADVLGVSWGGGLAQQFALSRPGPGAPPGAGGDRAGRADGSRSSAGPAAHAHAAPPPGPGTRGPHRR